MLSTLSDDVILSYEYATYTLTPSELRQRIEEGEALGNHTWYVCTPHKWKADAKRMIESYIDDQCQDMYEDWEEHAMDCLQQEHYDRIQAILDEAFSSEAVTDYWMLDGAKVIID